MFALNNSIVIWHLFAASCLCITHGRARALSHCAAAAADAAGKRVLYAQRLRRQRAVVSDDVISARPNEPLGLIVLGCTGLKTIAIDVSLLRPSTLRATGIVRNSLGQHW